MPNLFGSNYKKPGTLFLLYALSTLGGALVPTLMNNFSGTDGIFSCKRSIFSKTWWFQDYAIIKKNTILIKEFGQLSKFAEKVEFVKKTGILPEAKGQLISKTNCRAMNSSKKWTNEFVFTTMRHVFVRFFGRNWRHKKNLSKLTDL